MNFDVMEVVVKFVSIGEALDSFITLREIEDVNSLANGVIKRARWIKAVDKHRPGQKGAHAIFTFSSPETANHIIRNGLIVQSKVLEARKSIPEPCLCNKCQTPGHFAKECKHDMDVCGWCAKSH